MTRFRKNVALQPGLRFTCFTLLSVSSLSLLHAQIVTAQIPVGSLPQAIAVNSITNKTYVANTGSDTLTIIDGATATPTFLGVGSAPGAIAINTVTNKIYVADSGGVEVDVIDGVTNAITPLIAGSHPESIAVNPVTNKIYVANTESDNLTVIDGATNATTTIATGITPRAVAINQVTNKIYVANFSSGSVSVIDGATNTVTSIAAGTNPRAIAVNAVTNQIYVANYGSNNVTDIDGATATTTTIAAGTNPYAVTVNPVNNKIYVADYNDGTVSIINAALNTSITVATGLNPGSLAVNEVSGQVYIACQSDSNLYLLSGSTNQLTSLSVGGYALAVAVNPVTNQAYVANRSTNAFGTNNVATIELSAYTALTNRFGSNNAGAADLTQLVALNPQTNLLYAVATDFLAVFDASTNFMVHSYAAGIGPEAVAVNPVTNRVYVVDSGVNNAGAVSVLDGSNGNLLDTISLGANFSCNNGCIAVNPATNKIYVAGILIPLGNATGVLVIDGATGAGTPVAIPGANYPMSSNITVDPVTNKIYVLNFGLTIIDGVTNKAIRVATTPGTVNTSQFAVNRVTHKIYFASGTSTTHGIYVVDELSNTVTAEIAEIVEVTGLAVNPITNKVYAAGSDIYTGQPLLAVIDELNNFTPVRGINSGLGYGFPDVVVVDSVRNKIYAWQGYFYNAGPVYVIDGATSTVNSVVSDNFVGESAVLNPVTGAVYTQYPYFGAESAISPIAALPNPLTTTITPLSGNVTSSLSPTLHFMTSSTYAPIAPPARNVYFQLDSEQGPWIPATGSAPSFNATLSAVPLGSHVIYYYATDGSDSTDLAIGANHVGAISAYPFTVVNP